uniref:Uncharacterized protein n=1 Tax=Anopheles atroparvus TaxID=41427 RepID=A0AAG5DLG5_ANOAO
RSSRGVVPGASSRKLTQVSVPLTARRLAASSRRAFRVGAVTDDVGVAVVAHEVVVRPGVAVLDGVPGGHAARHPRGTVVDDLREVGEVGTGVAVRVAIDEVDRQRVLVEPVVDDVPDHAILGQVQPEVPDDGDVLAGLREAGRVAAVVVRVYARAGVRLCQQLELVVPVELRHPVGRKVAGQQAAGNLLPLPVVLLQYGGFAPRRHRHLHRLTVVARAAESRCRGAAKVGVSGRAKVEVAVPGELPETGGRHRDQHHHCQHRFRSQLCAPRHRKNAIGEQDFRRRTETVTEGPVASCEH